MWKVKRSVGSDTNWDVFKGSEIRGTCCICDDARFFANVDIGFDDPVETFDTIEQLIFAALAEEELLMSF
jgi:hypothetical protein